MAHWARVDSYADTAGLQRFVRRIFALDTALLPWLGAAGASRLVVVKPNWIQESHQERASVWEPIITHPALIEAVLRVIAEAMGGRGTIALCDAPHTYADFEKILGRGDLRGRLDDVAREFPALRLEVLDLRREIWTTRDDVIVARRANTPDPRGYVRVDLGRSSLFYRHRGEGRYYGADYDTQTLNDHHRGEVHEYLLAGTPMHCDLFVNLPKLKTHKKTGITCCLKNLVGINGDKNWLPHHCEGTPSQGGDEFPEGGARVVLERALKRLGRKAALRLPLGGPWLFRTMRTAGMRVLGDSQTVIRNGNWHGNDTCWRMALDLNRALLYANAAGTWGNTAAPRRYLAVVDGIVAGEGNGPICPDAVAAGVLIGGLNPAVVDAAAARLMGFEVGDLPIVREAFAAHSLPIAPCALEEVRVEGADGVVRPLSAVEAVVAGGFRPHFGWSTLRGRATHGR
jgi:uncharacterized protein (DUF362 family)